MIRVPTPVSVGLQSPNEIIWSWHGRHMHNIHNKLVAGEEDLATNCTDVLIDQELVSSSSGSSKNGSYRNTDLAVGICMRNSLQ